MGFFSKILGGAKKDSTPKGFEVVNIKSIDSVGSDTVKLTFDIPSELKPNFQFTPGQYIVLLVTLNGEQHHRSYSICSGTDEELAVAVKKVEGGMVSSYLNGKAQIGDSIAISKPEGKFTIPSNAQNVVLIAAGSGITPMMSMLKCRNYKEISFRLLYGARKVKDILFHDEIGAIQNVDSQFYLSGEALDGYQTGRISKENLSSVIKSDLSILKADAFMICGPEEMIESISSTLETFGVSKSKIHFELFTTPTKKGSASKIESYQGNALATIIIDGESEEISIKPGKVILDTAIDNGIDVPYSCKGGVCSTCKGKVLEGEAIMKMNYSLTDKEVAEGYILTCQACPTTEKITVTYDV